MAVISLRRSAPMLALALLSAACSTTQSLTPHPNADAHFAPWSDQPVEYRVGMGDKLRVEYLLTPEQNRDVIVGPDGYVALAPAGRVLAQGSTLGDVTARIEQASLRVLRHPMVTVSVLESRSARIIVGGAVRTPGSYAMPSGASPLEMISQAGGFLDDGRMNEVVVIRRRPGERAMLRTVDLRRFVERGEAEDDLVLASNDIVYVPRSHVGEAALWVDLHLNRLVPFNKNFNYNLGRYSGNNVP